jgi:hypothetical protein
MPDSFPTNRPDVIRIGPTEIGELQDSGGGLPRHRAGPVVTTEGHPDFGKSPVRRDDTIPRPGEHFGLEAQERWDEQFGRTHNPETGEVIQVETAADPRGGRYSHLDGGVDRWGSPYRTSGGKPKPVGEDTRTFDQLSRGEQKGEFGSTLDRKEKWFRDNYGIFDSASGNFTGFDHVRLNKANPKLKAQFQHLEHLRRVQTGIANGQDRGSLHAVGAKEHLYRRALYEGGVVMHDPNRTGAYILADPKTGRKIYNPAGGSRLKHTMQLERNQRRIAANPTYYRARAREGARRKMTIAARRELRKGNKVMAAMLMHDIDDPNHPTVLAAAGRFHGRNRNGNMVFNSSAFTDYMKQYQGVGGSFEDRLTPAQRLTYSNSSSGSAYQAERDRIYSMDTISDIERQKRLDKLDKKADKAAAEVANFDLSSTKREAPGSLMEDFMPKVWHTIDNKEGRGATDLHGNASLVEKRAYQQWLNLREKRYGKGRQDFIGPVSTFDHMDGAWGTLDSKRDIHGRYNPRMQAHDHLREDRDDIPSGTWRQQRGFGNRDWHRGAIDPGLLNSMTAGDAPDAPGAPGAPGTPGTPPPAADDWYLGHASTAGAGTEDDPYTFMGEPISHSYLTSGTAPTAQSLAEKMDYVMGTSGWTSDDHIAEMNAIFHVLQNRPDLRAEFEEHMDRLTAASFSPITRVTNFKERWAAEMYGDTASAANVGNTVMGW